MSNNPSSLNDEFGHCQFGASTSISSLHHDHFVCCVLFLVIIHLYPTFPPFKPLFCLNHPLNVSLTDHRHKPTCQRATHYSVVSNTKYNSTHQNIKKTSGWTQWSIIVFLLPIICVREF